MRSRASRVTGLGERDAFRAALRATMIKRASELPVFEELFDVYFSGLGEIIKQAGQGVQDALSMSDQEFQKFLDQVEEMLKKQGKKLSELAKQLLQNNSGQLEKQDCARPRARCALQGIERTIEENYFARALARALGLDKLEQEIKRAARADSRRSTSAPSSRPRWRSISIAGSRRSTTSSGATCGWSARSATCKRARRAAAQPARRQELLLSERRRARDR